MPGLTGSRPLASPHETVLIGVDHRLHPVAQVQLGEHPSDMCFHGRFGHEQLPGDLAVRQALGDERQNLALPLGEFGKLAGGGLLASWQQCRELVDEPPSRGRRDH